MAVHKQIFFRLRRGTRAEWIAQNPVLRPGEPGLEVGLDVPDRIKFGDGVTPWMLLPYFSSGDQSTIDLQAHIDDETPHPVYDDAPSLALVYQNAKV